MPQVTDDERFGQVSAWLKEEGDKVSPGDALCEVECTDFGFSLNADEMGWVAQILVPEGMDKVPAGTPLCVLVDRKEDIALYLADHEAKAAPGQFVFTTKDLMLAIGRLLQKKEVSNEIGLRLLSLARRNNLSLYEAFHRSINEVHSGGEYSGPESLNVEVFLPLAKDVVQAHFPASSRGKTRGTESAQ